MPLPFSLSSLSVRRRLVRWASLGILLTAVLALALFQPFDYQENTSLDLRFRWRALQPVNKHIIVIEVDDPTLKELGYWPLPRDFHASLVDVLTQLGAKQIFFDFIFTDSSPDDAVFAQSLTQSGRVYLPYVLAVGEGISPKRLVYSTGYVAGLRDELRQSAKGTGHINSIRDIDGKTRWVPLLIRDKVNTHPQVALKMATDYLGLPLEDVRTDGQMLVIDGKLRIPVSKGESLLVNFAGPWGKTFRHYSYVEVLKAFRDYTQGKRPPINLKGFKNAVCFIGLTATGTTDIQPVPVQNDYPLVGLHANIFNSIIQNDYVFRIDAKTNSLVILVLLVLVSVVAWRWKENPFGTLVFTGGVIGVFFTVCILVFNLGGLWVDFFYPVRLVLLTYATLTIMFFIQANKRRELVEKELSIAKNIQESFLPDPVEHVAGLQVATEMSTAKEVGGDLYDFARLEEGRLGVFIGDVSGKGVGAALVMAKTITMFRLLAEAQTSPAQLLASLNREMHKHKQRVIFVTATYLVYEAAAQTVSLSSAGHSPTLWVRAQANTVERISPKDGMPLNVFLPSVYSEEKIHLGTNDKIVLYTDGVTEARNEKGEEFGSERLEDILRATILLDAKATLQTILSALGEFSGFVPQHDDCTLIILQRI
jgi:CHASE2 domain-containing sensor protein